jgi:hypothetical protein
MLQTAWCCIAPGSGRGVTLQDNRFLCLREGLCGVCV